MTKRITLLSLLFTMLLGLASAEAASPKAVRRYWVNTMLRIATPVYEALAEERLREDMPVEVNDGSQTGKRANVSHLEALGRSFNGIAPWLNLGDEQGPEGEQRREMTELVVKAITNAVNPSSPDYLRFDGPGSQPLVDAAFFAQGLLRSKDVVWPRLDDVTRARIIEEFKRSRKIRAWENNWLLFSATIEAALLHFTGECDFTKIKYALERHDEWYKGDGWYGDGKTFHLDYYNSYVIQPMLVDVAAVLKANADKSEEYAAYGAKYDLYLKRMTRYAAQQYMLISPEGSYPMLGRSCGYRYGAFQALSHAALLGALPEGVAPAQVRTALTAVMKRQTVKDMFDDEGWLTLGFYGHQPAVAENYVSTGSAYLCCFVFLPLGLPADAEFWSEKDAKWLSQLIWSGEPVMRDAAISD